MTQFDLVIAGGHVATATDVMRADIGIKDGRIAAIAGLIDPADGPVVDASERIVTPGGVDSHCHIEQLAASGLVNADTFLSATTSAALGGTTTVIPFAAQHIGMSLRQVVDDYHELAGRQAVVDYAFHMILTDPRPEIIRDELPGLVGEGHSSLKVFMTYDRLRIDDDQFLAVLGAARTHRCMVCVHAENHGMISWMSRRLVERGYTRSPFHVTSHPRAGEAEAINRAIALASLFDQPLMIFHLSTAEGLATIRQAQESGQKVFAETCTQYLTMTKAELDKPGIDGAMWICSPPIREVSDQTALWQALRLGTLQTVSSDHAPYRMDESGKLAKGPSPTFKEIANGMPGLELRMPVLFDAMVSQGRMGLNAFVRLTATEPARIYNLHDRKGSIAVGLDADLVLWDPTRTVEITHDTTHDHAGYTPYTGRRVTGWPETVIRRGEIVAQGGQLMAKPGSGRFLSRDGGDAATPSGRTSPELDPTLNGGADLWP